MSGGKQSQPNVLRVPVLLVHFAQLPSDSCHGSSIRHVQLFVLRAERRPACVPRPRHVCSARADGDGDGDGDGA